MKTKRLAGKTRASALAAVFLLMPLSEAAAGANCKSIAKSFSRQAEKAGVRRVAVLPFRALDDSPAAHGRFLAEKLTTQLTRRGGVRVVERSMLDAVMSEHRLGRSGVLASEKLGKIGRMLQAQAVVVGTFVTIGNAVEFNVRLIHIETGILIDAEEARVKREWFASEGLFGRPERISALDTAVEILVFQRGAGVVRWSPPRDSGIFNWKARRTIVSDAAGCEGADERVNAMQESIIDLKARYWARMVRQGKLSRELLYKPGESIPDPNLRARFFMLVATAAEREAKPLSMSEMKRFITKDREAFMLRLECLKTEPATARASGGGTRYAKDWRN